jgi:hypothetical protein
MQYADIAQTLASKGRNGDSVLVHMTPGEVGGLQALAQSQGGSLTVNPETGMPEAFFLAPLLGAILPSLTAGTFLAPLFSSALATGLTLGGVEALRTGDLSKGLSAGLGAFGGASLGSALNATGAAASGALDATGAATSTLPSMGAAAQPSVMTPSLANLNAPAVGELGGLNAMGAAAQPSVMAPSLANLNAPAVGETLSSVGGAGMPAVVPAPSLSNMGAGLSDLTTKGGLGRFGSAFSDAAGGGLGTAAATMGLASPIMDAMQPKFKLPELGEKSDYKGPYRSTEREVRYPTDRDRSDSSEYLYFTPTNPMPGFRTMAEGGEVKRFQTGGMVTNAEYMRGRPIRQPMPFPPQAFANPMMQRGLQLGRLGMQMMPPVNYGAPRGTPLNAMIAARTQQLPVRREASYGFRPMQNIAPYAPPVKPETPVAPPPPTREFFDRDGGGMASGGLASLNAFNQGGMAKGRFLQGPGDGTSDSIPANIGGTQPARLADGEFVVDARTVSELGNGSSKAGANKLYAMMERVHSARKKAKRGQDSNADKHLPA